MQVRLLVTGDIHIGRRPTRVPDGELAERASAARMWEAIVERAMTECVNAVLLSGDIVDEESRYYEATGALERGILKLAKAAIPTYAVAGNHDWDVFPRILRQLDTSQFHFLGPGGSWQEAFLEIEGERILRMVGWSFPEKRVRESPLREFPFSSDPGVPTVGLLHADVDVPNSPYAPVRLAELQSSGVDFWVLGHQHGPRHWSAEAGPQVLYPGSPQALDPGEEGAHGPWLVEFEGPRRVACRQLPMSLVRYETRDVDLTGARNDEDFENHVQAAASSAVAEVAEGDDSFELALLRLRFVGSTPLCGRIERLARNITDLERSRGKARIDKYHNLTRPEVNLEELSRRYDPAGLLARTLVELEKGVEDGPLSSLLRDALARLNEVRRTAAYAPLHGDPDADFNAARQILLQQGRQLLDALRAQIPAEQEAPA